MEKPYVKISKIFGGRVRQLRQQLGYSQETLAEKVGISQTFLSAVERGQKFPSAEVIESLALVLEVPYFRLFVDPEDKPFSLDESTEQFIREVQNEVRRLVLDWIAKQEHSDTALHRK